MRAHGLALLALLATAAAWGDDGSAGPPAEPQVLAGDAYTTATWLSARDRLAATNATLMAELGRPGNDTLVAAALRDFQAALDHFHAAATAVAPARAIDFDERKAAIEHILDRVADDYAFNRPELAGSAVDLQKAMAATETLADDATGLHAFWGFPGDWGAGAFQDKTLEPGFVLLPLPDVLQEVQSACLRLRNDRERGLDDDEIAALEGIGLLARQLVRRANELPGLRRPGFRNCALQMEVLAENALRLGTSRDRRNYRRQLRMLEETRSRAEAFLEMPP